MFGLWRESAKCVSGSWISHAIRNKLNELVGIPVPLVMSDQQRHSEIISKFLCDLAIDLFAIDFEPFASRMNFNRR